MVLPLDFLEDPGAGDVEEAYRRLEELNCLVDELDIRISEWADDLDSDIEEITRLEIQKRHYCAQAFDLMLMIDELEDPDDG